jgi:flavodoxin
MRVLVLYESRRGFTLTVARALRDAMRERGVEATAAPLRRVDAGTLAAADALVVGTWVSGLIVVGVGPAPGTREGVDALPDLEGMPTVVFCTCEVTPRGSLSTLTDWLEARGADVRGRAVFKRKKSLATAPDVATSILDVLAPDA